MMKHTIQERKNHRKFGINVFAFLFFLLVFQFGTIKGYIFLFFIGIVGLVFCFGKMGLIGFRHGWELKRISLQEEEEIDNV